MIKCSCWSSWSQNPWNQRLNLPCMKHMKQYNPIFINPYNNYFSEICYWRYKKLFFFFQGFSKYCFERVNHTNNREVNAWIFFSWKNYLQKLCRSILCLDLFLCLKFNWHQTRFFAHNQDNVVNIICFFYHWITFFK